jgi:hypothetical protein
MRHDFPSRVDAFPIRQDLDERNASEKTDTCDIVDIMYAVRGLQAYVLELAASLTAIQTARDGTQSAVDVSALSTQITTLQTQVERMPKHYEYAGTPPDSMGVNGSTCWDTVNSITYTKAGGVWRQVA